MHHDTVFAMNTHTQTINDSYRWHDMERRETQYSKILNVNQSTSRRSTVWLLVMLNSLKNRRKVVRLLALVGFTVCFWGLNNFFDGYQGSLSEWWNSKSPREMCLCQSFESLDKFEQPVEDLPQSTCSDEATLAGPQQTIISYSFYEGPEPDSYNRSYFDGIQRQIDGIREFYPGALMRLYSDISLTTSRHSVKMCQLICQNQDLLYYCPIQQIRNFGSLSRVQHMIWRFLPLGDATVREFNVRDLDSRITQREVDAVTAWRASNFHWHGMRDHPHHCAPIVGGAWGGNNHRIGLKTAQQVIQSIVAEGRDRYEYRVDQQVIAKHIYTPYNTQMLSHDAYCCTRFNGSAPFPTKRTLNNHHVVQVDLGMNEHLVAICPQECRPTYGQDWERC